MSQFGDAGTSLAFDSALHAFGHQTEEALHGHAVAILDERRSELAAEGPPKDARRSAEQFGKLVARQRRLLFE